MKTAVAWLIEPVADMPGWWWCKLDCHHPKCDIILGNVTYRWEEFDGDCMSPAGDAGWYDPRDIGTPDLAKVAGVAVEVGDNHYQGDKVEVDSAYLVLTDRVMGKVPFLDAPFDLLNQESRP